MLVDVGVQHIQVTIWSTTSPIQHHHTLCITSHSSIGLQVSIIRFSARFNDGQRTNLHHTAKCSHLNRITKSSASSMQLCHTDICRREVRLSERIPDALLLRGPVRCCHTGASSILVDTATTSAGQAICFIFALIQCLHRTTIETLCPVKTVC